MRVLILSVLLLGCHRDLDDGVVDESGSVAETSSETSSVEDSGVADSVSDTCECAPGETVAVSGACPGALEKKSKTCDATCKWKPEECALPKGWTAIASPPSGFAGRLFPAAAWTGGELLVHGGQSQVEGGTTYADGAIYSVAKNTWSVLPSDKAPTARSAHSGVWTGLEFIVWGGSAGTTLRGDGAVYDAFTKSWRSLPAAPISPRSAHAAIWVVGSNEMLVWGGRDESGPLADGAAFSNASQTWSKLPDAPISARSLPHIAWTGSELLIWGGNGVTDRRADGALYNPLRKSWRTIPPSPIGGRIFAATAITSKSFVFLGGIGNEGTLKDGAMLSLTDLKWTPIAAAPATIYEPRDLPASWQHGELLYAWSGARGSTTIELVSSGATFDVTSSTWNALASVGAPPPRIYATTVATKFGAVLWSGIGAPGGGVFEVLNDGAVFAP